MHASRSDTRTDHETTPRSGSSPTHSAKSCIRSVALPATMPALVQRQYGTASQVLEFRTVDVPTPADDEVLIEVDAAGVDRGVWHLMTGQPWLIRLMGFGLRRPKQPVPGLDVAGRVVRIGASVTGFSVGDHVVGVGSGTYARYACAPVEKLCRRPSSVPPEQAASVPISGMTALQALRDIGRVQAGQRVLVLGASGGVGSFAVQLARHFGAQVSGVASGAKLDFVSSLGAERVIDYQSEDALDGSMRFDLILDIGGRNSLRDLRRALTPEGTLVVVGGEGGNRLTGSVGRLLRAVLLSPFVSQRLTSFVSPERGEDVATLMDLLADGTLKAPVMRTYSLEHGAEALDDLAQGRVRGKAVITIR